MKIINFIIVLCLLLICAMPICAQEEMNRDRIRAKIGILIKSGDRFIKAKAQTILKSGDLFRIYVNPEDRCVVYVIHADKERVSLLDMTK